MTPAETSGGDHEDKKSEGKCGVSTTGHEVANWLTTPNQAARVQLSTAVLVKCVNRKAERKGPFVRSK